jgi:ATP-dependent DNA helicase RecG
LRRIRNVPQKLFPSNQLLPVEIQKYETRSILEGMHNCIAHQDYERQERILVTEISDRLIFENAGSFFEGKAEDYFKGTQTARRYRNPWLAHAMVEVSMIDTAGNGIHKMTESQRGRYLPLPDYRRSTDTHTVLEVLGRPIDEKYSQLLLEKHDLDIDTVILLDRVQKQLPIADTAAARLRREGFIEGRKGNLRVSARMAAATETEVGYTHSKGVETEQLKEMLKGHLKRFPGASRPDIDKLLHPLLASSLNDTQKRDKITNLLSAMKNRDHSIRSVGRGPGAKWYAAKDGA